MTHANLKTETLQHPVAMPYSKPVGSSLMVCVKESGTEFWKEVTDIVSVSRTGAGFTLKRPCSVGRLVLLKTTLPRELRVYDHEAKLYSIIGLVQFCHPVTTEDGTTLYDIGVGFIGNVTPESFKKDPKQSYRITGTSPDGMWRIMEVDSPFKDRRHPRYQVKLPVLLTIIGEQDRTLAQERGMTANVGIGGASVVTTLKGKVGVKVKFACSAFDFYSMAVIRGIRQNESGPGLLHLQFIGEEFPIDRMLVGQMSTDSPPKQTTGAEAGFFYR